MSDVPGELLELLPEEGICLRWRRRMTEKVFGIFISSGKKYKQPVHPADPWSLALAWLNKSKRSKRRQLSDFGGERWLDAIDGVEHWPLVHKQAERIDKTPTARASMHRLLYGRVSHKKIRESMEDQVGPLHEDTVEFYADFYFDFGHMTVSEVNASLNQHYGELAETLMESVSVKDLRRLLLLKEGVYDTPRPEDMIVDVMVRSKTMGDVMMTDVLPETRAEAREWYKLSVRAGSVIATAERQKKEGSKLPDHLVPDLVFDDAGSIVSMEQIGFDADRDGGMTRDQLEGKFNTDDSVSTAPLVKRGERGQREVDSYWDADIE